jgi:hypothetical protein
MQVANDRAGVSFAITNLTTGRVVQFFQSAPQSGSGRSFKVSGATAEWVMERSADAPDPTLPAASKLRHGGFRDCGATAINMNTGATTERSLSARKER